MQQAARPLQQVAPRSATRQTRRRRREGAVRPAVPDRRPHPRSPIPNAFNLAQVAWPPAACSAPSPCRRRAAPVRHCGVPGGFRFAGLPADASPARRHGRPPHRREAGGARGAQRARRRHGQVRRRFAIPVQGLPSYPGGARPSSDKQTFDSNWLRKDPTVLGIAFMGWTGARARPRVAACTAPRRARRSRCSRHPRRSAVQHPRLRLRRQVPVRPVHGLHRLQLGSCLCDSRLPAPALLASVAAAAALALRLASALRPAAHAGREASRAPLHAPHRRSGCRLDARTRLASALPAVGAAVRAPAAPIAVEGQAAAHLMPLQAPSVPLRVAPACGSMARGADDAAPLLRLRRRTGPPARRWTTSSGCT